MTQFSIPAWLNNQNINCHILYLFKDIQLTAANDEHYFIFEDIVYKTILCFSRDSEVAINSNQIKFYHLQNQILVKKKFQKNLQL